MRTVSILVGLLVVLIAYQFAPTGPLLPVEPGDAIVVTGSSTGIGKHATLTLAKEGYTVFACVRKPKDGEALLKSAEKFDIDPSYIKPILLDVTNPEQIAAGVETVSAFVGDRGLYGLFNNAGVGADPRNVGGAASVEHMPMESFRFVFEVNYFGLVQVTKAFLPLLRKRKGRIINNTSIAGIFAGPFISAYSGTKFAVEALSDSLRREVEPHGVKVSVLEPGYVSTPILKQSLLNIPEGEGVYAGAEVSGFKRASKMAMDAASPRVTSEAVVHAMRAATPRTRYLVGRLSGFVKFLSHLPDRWADAIMHSNLGEEVNPEELMELAEKTSVEFEL